VDLEFHQLECPYEWLRVRRPERERRLLASLADHGQQMPIVVVRGTAAGYVVVDGHKRVRCLKRLHRDSVTGLVWEMSVPDALIFRQMAPAEGSASALEQGWLLRALHEGHELRLADLAQRFDRSVSWVSRRLALTRELVVTEPLLVLRVEQEAQRDSVETSGAAGLLSDLHAIGALARRACGRLRRGLLLLPPDRERASRALRQALSDVGDLQNRWEKDDARSRHTRSDPDAAEPWAGYPPDRSGATDLARSGEEGPVLGDARRAALGTGQ
jgi:ParB-like chromosome segregation protein Spo0J